MPKPTKDEIISNYADITKQSADIVDYAQEVATAGAAELAIVAPIMAITGKGLLAALGGPVGIALALGALAYGLYQVSKQTDDNINDLVDRLNALDPKDEHTEAFINDWIRNLQGFKPVLVVPTTTTDPVERAKANKQKLDGMSRLASYLAAMRRDWPMLKARLTDWGFDPGQAENA